VRLQDCYRELYSCDGQHAEYYKVVGHDYVTYQYYVALREHLFQLHSA
jgi:hypothetical protein